MTPKLKPILLSACLLARAATAAIVVPGANGTDGALNITTDTVIDLSQAPTGSWDQDNTANAGKGVYDPQKWAVVFKYTAVTVAAGKTVTFKNHASRAPVVWLVSGNVTISGTVSLNGQNTVNPPLLAEPGPGGFRGGQGYYVSGVAEGAGFGVGGSGTNKIDYNRVGSASYGSQGRSGPLVYGNPSIIPLIGGSGGAGSGATYTPAGPGGGGGGGAILIACANQVAINGTIRSDGGNGSSSNFQWGSGAGSGGGIRVVSDAIVGSGYVSALGGQGMYDGPSGVGRIRIERVTNSGSIAVNPAPSTVDLAAGASALLWPPAGAPEARVVSIGAVNAPSDPRAAFGTYTPDVALPLVNTTQVIVETVNVEQVSQVKVRITPRDSANYTEVNATYSSTISSSPLTLRWTATLPTKMGHSAIQARIIRP
jgi:hypothetical protein